MFDIKKMKKQYKKSKKNLFRSDFFMLIVIIKSE